MSVDAKKVNGDISFISNKQTNFSSQQAQQSGFDTSSMSAKHTSVKMPKGVLQQPLRPIKPPQQSNLLIYNSGGVTHTPGQNNRVKQRMSNLDDPSQGGRAATAVSSIEGEGIMMRSGGNHGSSLPRFKEDNNNDPISEGGPLNSGRSLSTNFHHHPKLLYPQLASEGAVMLESLRKKKETETQLKMLENRIRRLKDEEQQAKVKQSMQKRQIDQIIRIRMQAQEEKEQQRKRKEQVQREMEERKMKVQKDKQVIVQSRVRSVRRQQYEVMKVVGELKNESRARVEQIMEMRERMVVSNQQVAKAKGSTPFKLLEERRQKLLKENRHQYLMRLAQNYQESEANSKRMQELQRLEQSLIERLQEHTKKQAKVQEEYQTLLGIQQPPIRVQHSQQHTARPGTVLNIANNQSSIMQTRKMRATSIGFTQQRHQQKRAVVNNFLEGSISKMSNTEEDSLRKPATSVGLRKPVVKRDNEDDYADEKFEIGGDTINKRTLETPKAPQVKAQAIKISQDDDYEDDFKEVKPAVTNPSPKIVQASPKVQPKARVPEPVKQQRSSNSSRYTDEETKKPVVKAAPAVVVKKQSSKADSYEDDYQDDYTSTFRSNPLQAAKPATLAPAKQATQPVAPPSKQEPYRLSDDYEEEADFGDTENLLAHTQQAPTALRNPQALLSSGNSDQNAASDEYQEIGDHELMDEEAEKQERRARIEARRQEILKDVPVTELQKMLQEQRLKELDFLAQSDDDDGEDDAKLKGGQ